MPPSGTTGKSSATGARGPTGPKGEARSSPAGNKGGAPGSSTRSSSGSTGSRGPTGPSGESRSSPAGGGNRGGGGKDSSISRTTTGPRGPTGPQGQARNSPAGSGGGKAGAVSRTSSGPRGPVAGGKPRTSPAGGVAGASARSPSKKQSQFERFSARYPGGIENMPVKAISPPVPGGFGPAGSAIGSAIANAQRYVGNLLGAGKKAFDAQKYAKEMSQVASNLDKVRKSQAGALPGKIAYRIPERTLAQTRAAANVPLSQRVLDKVDDTIDYATSRVGLGTGPVARAHASGAIGAGTEAGMAVNRPNFGFDSGRTPTKAETAPKPAGQRDNGVASGKTDRGRLSTNASQKGKSDFGGYRGGGLAKSKRSYRVR